MFVSVIYMRWLPGLLAGFLPLGGQGASSNSSIHGLEHSCRPFTSRRVAWEFGKPQVMSETMWRLEALDWDVVETLEVWMPSTTNLYIVDFCVDLHCRLALKVQSGSAPGLCKALTLQRRLSTWKKLTSEVSFEWKSQRCDIVASNCSTLVHQKVQCSSMQTHSINCQL